MNSKLTSPEFLATIGAAIAAAAAIAKKLITRKSAKPKPEYISRAEFHHGMDAVRDRIAAGYMALADKIDFNHREIERRLDNLDTTVARLDERTTRLAPQMPNVKCSILNAQ